MTDRIHAPYLVETAHSPVDAAEAMAGEQSLGTFVDVPGETEELRKRYAGRVRSSRSISQRRTRACCPTERTSRTSSPTPVIPRMAILEPVLAWTLAATCLVIIRDGFDRAIKTCVPPNAARALLFGHLRIDLGVVFGYTDFSFSDGARQAIADGKADIVRDDRDDRVFERDRIRQSAREIADPTE